MAYHPGTDLIPVQFMKFLIVCCVFALSLGGGTFVLAEEPRSLNWQDLAPEMEEIHNPFLELSIEQTLTFRGYLEQLQVPEIEHTVEQQERQRELREQLEADGLKPDEMVVLYDELVARYQQAQSATSPEVLGEAVKLPGYLLPLSVKDGAVTEFLLVPTVGACIHEPVPPANQMVYVRFEEGFKEAGLFNPVWIQGELKADPRTESLHLVDGASDVDVSYTMDAEAVWLY